VLALAGGVGGAKLADGLARLLGDELCVIVNTGDDDWFHGLYVCPDLDSVTYTLAGAQNPDTGWGLAGETFATVDALARFGEETWFRLGDRDLATHLFRTRLLREGATLSDATARITRAWDLAPQLLPMTDDRVATRITTDTGELAMQEWFVRERCEPPVLDVQFAGADDARPAPGVLDAIALADTVLVCPSNPVISIGPILAVPGGREALVARRDRVVGVSPIIAGRPVKGPADRLMGALGIDVSCVGVAREYRPFCSALVIDTGDAARAGEIEALGVRAVVADTLMTDARIAAALARDTLAAVA
jgi:LPPG:FO 2-phospho-L-lactate transferase